MASWKRREKQADTPWIVVDVSDSAQNAAERAAAASGVPLEVWLADTVLRASQEGVGEHPFAPAEN